MEEKNPDVVTYCGLCCLDCHGHRGKIADLARDLRKELRQAKYEKFADTIAKIPIGKPFEHYQQCYNLLGAMVKFRCKKGAGMAVARRFVKSDSAARKKRLPVAGNAMNQKRVKNFSSLFRFMEMHISGTSGQSGRRELRVLSLERGTGDLAKKIEETLRILPLLSQAGCFAVRYFPFGTWISNRALFP
jgi:hypothetical protein